VIDWGLLLLPGAVLLIVPLAIVPAYRRSTGSIVVSGALATIAFAAFWLVLGGTSGLGRGIPISGIEFYCGLLLTVATWILSLNAAAQARRWVWVGLLLVAGYLTLAAVYASFTLQICFGGTDSEFTCPPPDPLRQALVFVGYLGCPIAALVYGVRAPGRRVRTLPDGLTVSSLHARPTAEAATTAVVNDAEGAGGE
jgi:hypothetical protein